MSELTKQEQEELKDRKRYYTVGEIAELFGVPTRVIRTLLKEGKLKYFKVGTAVRITQSMIDDYVARFTGKQSYADNSSEQHLKLKEIVVLLLKLQ